VWLGVLVEGILNQPWVVGGCRFRVLDDRLGGRVWHVPGAGVGADLGDLGAGMTTGGDGQSVAPDRELVGEKPLAPCLPEQPQPFHRPPRVRFRPGPGWRYTRYIGDCLVPSRPRKRHRHPRGARGRALRAQGQRIWCLCLLSATGPPAVAPTVAPPATWPLQTSSCRYGPTLQGRHSQARVWPAPQIRPATLRRGSGIQLHFEIGRLCASAPTTVELESHRQGPCPQCHPGSCAGRRLPVR